MKLCTAWLKQFRCHSCSALVSPHPAVLEQLNHTDKYTFLQVEVTIAYWTGLNYMSISVDVAAVEVLFVLAVLACLHDKQ